MKQNLDLHVRERQNGRPLKTQASNWYIVISISFCCPRQVTWIKPKSSAGEIQLAPLLGKIARSVAKGMGTRKDRELEPMMQSSTVITGSINLSQILCIPVSTKELGIRERGQGKVLSGISFKVPMLKQLPFKDFRL